MVQESRPPPEQLFDLKVEMKRMDRPPDRPAQITDKADSKVGFLHFQAIIAKKLEVGEGLS